MNPTNMAIISKAQEGRYWRQWSRVRKALVDLGEFSKADADAERHAIHREALGKDKSHTAFNNSDLNNVFDAFDNILVIFDGPSDKPTRTAANLIWAIERLHLPEATVTHLAQDAYGRSPDWTGDWRKLSERRLTCLRYTCTRHARTLAKREPA